MRRLTYILAASHSGSTLLSMLLGAHPDACTVGELKLSIPGDLERYRCGCGEPIKHCSFWQKVSSVMKREGINFEIGLTNLNILSTDNPYIHYLLKPLHRGPFLEVIRDIALSIQPAWHTHRNDVKKKNIAIIEALHEVTGAKVIIDSSKIGLRLKYLLKDKETDIRIIRLIRDGRGVALTHTDPFSFADAKDPGLRAGGYGGNRENERSIIDAANEWQRSNEEAEAVLATVDRSRWTEIRYEQLCKDPDNTLSDLCIFLNLAPEKITRDFRKITQHVIGNGMRLDNSSLISHDERWKTCLTAEQLRIFDSVAGQMNRKYGYV
jgi:hypothetical protein